MTSLLEPVINFASSQNMAVRLLLTFAIIVAGHALAKIATRVTRYLWKRTRQDQTKKEFKRREQRIRQLSYIIDAVAVGLALFYLNTSFTGKLYSDFIEALPEIVSVILLGVLGVIVINITANSVKGLLQTINFERHLGIRKSAKALRLFVKVIKAVLYLVLIKVMAEQLGVGETFVDPLITASSWAIAFLAAAIVFWSSKDLFRNLAAGIYLRNSRSVKPQEKVYLDEESGRISRIDLFSTEIETETGYRMLTQNTEIMESEIKFKNTQNDVETLEDIKKYFTAQNPSYCGPASAEMALSIFGYRYSQEEIGEIAKTKEGKGTMPDELIKAVEELTDGEVHADYVEHENITDLAEEFKAWFNDGALIIPNFAKPVLFPGADTAHYSLCVGVEGDELLIVDPSAHTASGGVYYADSAEMLEAMSEFEGRRRGYLVLAPEDTTAHWRIEKGLIYSDANLYDQINKNMELQLRRILRQGRILKSVLPDALDDYLERWKKEERVGRMWKPEKVERGDSSEATDTS